MGLRLFAAAQNDIATQPPDNREREFCPVMLTTEQQRYGSLVTYRPAIVANTPRTKRRIRQVIKLPSPFRKYQKYFLPGPLLYIQRMRFREAAAESQYPV